MTGERPKGHDGPCCSSCIDDQNAYDEGLIDHSHDMHPNCCCRDERTEEEAEAAYNAWIAS